ncbi:MAG: hypothetical protein WDZ94_01875 [Patescibacteria group bacterium]
MNKIVVVPTIREDSYNRWISEWRGILIENEVKVILVEDNPQKTFNPNYVNIEHYSWNEIDLELGDKKWIIPRRTAAIRSFGFYKAYGYKPDYIVTLDDDCYTTPESKNYFETHEKYLFADQYKKRWIQHSQGLRVRGFPEKLDSQYNILNMGLWANIPDLDGETQKKNPDYRITEHPFNFIVPNGSYAPISSMNLAIKTQAVPAFYFLLMGPSYPFDRFDDIWAGIFLIKIAHHLGHAVSGGEPFIWHDRASDAEVNIKKEAPGKKVNEFLWKDVDKITLTGTTYSECYRELAEKLPKYDEYWNKQSEAMLTWLSLFQ